MALRPPDSDRLPTPPGTPLFVAAASLAVPSPLPWSLVVRKKLNLERRFPETDRL